MTLVEACCYGFNPMVRNARRWLLLLLALLATGFFFYRFRNSITLQGFAWSRVAASLRHANLGLLFLSLVVIYGCYAVRALRWMRFSRALGELRFGNVYAATLMGFACTFILGRAGEPIRPALISKKDSVSMPAMFGVYVLERVFDVAATAVLAGVALFFFRSSGFTVDPGTPLLAVARTAGVALIVGLVAVVSFLVYFRYHGAQWLRQKLKESSWHHGWRGKTAGLLEGFSEGLQGIRSWADMNVLIGYSVIHWVGVVFAYLWIAHAFGGELAKLTFMGAVLVLAFTMMGSALQLPGVGGGAQVASFLVLTLIFGIDKEPAAVVAIIFWVISFATCSLLGLPLLFREGWSMGELKRMATAGAQAAQEAESAVWSENSGDLAP